MVGWWGGGVVGWWGGGVVGWWGGGVVGWWGGGAVGRWGGGAVGRWGGGAVRWWLRQEQSFTHRTDRPVEIEKDHMWLMLLDQSSCAFTIGHNEATTELRRVRVTFRVGVGGLGFEVG